MVAKMRKNEGATQQAGLDGHQPAAARRLPPPVSAGHYPGGATTLGELTPPRTGSSCIGGRWSLLPPSKYNNQDDGYISSGPAGQV